MKQKHINMENENYYPPSRSEIESVYAEELQRSKMRAVENTEQTTKSVEKKYPKQKTPEDEKKPIVIGVVDDIKPGNSKFGYSAKIYIAGQVYFFNYKEPSTLEKMFQKGQKCAFTMEEVNGFKKVVSIFFTF
jgi:hypothetical protein